MAAEPLHALYRRTSLRFNVLPYVYQCEPDWRGPDREVPDFDVWLILSGSGWVDRQGGREALTAGRCLMFPPGTRLVAGQDATDRLTVLVMHVDFLDADGRTLGARDVKLPNPGQAADDTVTLHHLAATISRLARRPDPASHAGAEAAVWTLLLSLEVEARATAGSASDQRLQRLVHAIEADPRRPWTVDDLARRACLSRAQLTRQFRRCTGLPPKAFVLNCRIHRAKFLLLDSAMTLKQVATAMGYRDIYYFSRQFKRMTGQSPAAFRRQDR